MTNQEREKVQVKLGEQFHATKGTPEHIVIIREMQSLDILPSVSTIENKDE